MLIDKYTKHSIFSLPLIFDDIVDRHELKANGFVNMYVYDLNIPLASNHIFLVFKNLSNELLEKFEMSAEEAFILQSIIVFCLQLRQQQRRWGSSRRREPFLRRFPL